ncbi:site-specific integrase [Bosea sp. CS1GBMeth4]|uniref:site-specific integrase n=1 Tax=Bosea sp. CS1GBMeth4 TaxID=1892849 RepID=UPI0016448E60|nr:site-specific integrase [Bosea sp. CS1GBMeth4]
MKHLSRKPSGLYMYQRRIPLDIRKHYPGRVILKASLETYDEREAIQRCLKRAAEDDRLWASWRSPAGQDAGLTSSEAYEAAEALLRLWDLKPGDGFRTGPDAKQQTGDVLDVPLDYFASKYGEEYHLALQGKHPAGRSPSSFLEPHEALAMGWVLNDPSKKIVLLSDARDSYLKHKGEGEKFDQQNKRYVQGLIDLCGDLPLGDYARQNVNDLRDKMLAKGNKTATVKRYFKSLSAIFTHGIDEYDLKGVSNPFVRFKIPKDGQDAKEVPPFTIEEVRRIQAECRVLDDTPRHMAAIQSDTGTRISEIIGLRIEDIILDHKAPHMLLRERRDLGRRLKTKNSTRKVPLVGMALWGAQRALKLCGSASEGWLFPQYAADGAIKSNSATNTVNKWLKVSLKIPKTSHSFRHALADRLRHVDTREELIKAIGGWKEYNSMLANYGEGFLIEQLHRELVKVVL